MQEVLPLVVLDSEEARARSAATFALIVSILWGLYFMPAVFMPAVDGWKHKDSWNNRDAPSAWRKPAVSALEFL
jgi:hypothetical protein